MSWHDYLWAASGPASWPRNLLTGLDRPPLRQQVAALRDLGPRPAPLRCLALAVGLVLFLRSRHGRFSSWSCSRPSLPFAFTFRISGGNEWRFTLLAYPFYLVAAALSLERARAGSRASSARSGTKRRAPPAGPEEARG